MTVKQQARRAALRRFWDEAGVEFGRCLCGCGRETEPAPKTVDGLVRGLPKRYVLGHQNAGARGTTLDRNPGGICWCGCGGEVSMYFPSRTMKTPVHARFIAGHQARKSPVDWVERDCGFETPCWVWQRKVTRKGYGIVEATKARPRAQQAHRWVYEREVGPIAEGHELHHRCENKVCVRPSHCEPLPEAVHKALHAGRLHAPR